MCKLSKVKSEKITRISQQVESDATPPTQDSSVSFHITPDMTRGDDQADEDVDDIDDQGQVMSDVQDFTAVGKTCLLYTSPSPRDS